MWSGRLNDGVVDCCCTVAVIKKLQLRFQTVRSSRGRTEAGRSGPTFDPTVQAPRSLFGAGGSVVLASAERPSVSLWLIKGRGVSAERPLPWFCLFSPLTRWLLSQWSYGNVQPGEKKINQKIKKKRRENDCVNLTKNKLKNKSVNLNKLKPNLFSDTFE